MLIRFHSRHSADFIMFGDIALTFIRMMGHSGTVPGAMSAEEVPGALERLRHTLSGPSGVASPTAAADEETAAESVTLGRRAVPLIDMLTTAAERGDYIMWETA